MQRRDRLPRYDEPPHERRRAPPVVYSLALTVAIPVLAVLLLSPAGPAFLLSLAAFALAAFVL